MILVTGATGFVGRHLVRRLAGDAGLQVRVLLRPGSDTTRLPRGVPVHAMVGKITDVDSLLAAMDGVHTVFHLVGTETRGRHAQLEDVDIASIHAVVEAGLAARIGRLIYVSRVGADRASAFPVLRAKGEIEDVIRRSGLAYTIFRSSVLFGKGDRFSEHIAMLARAFPVYFVPGDGEMILQPLWVEDLVTCLAMSLEDLSLIDATLSLGGPELLSYRRVVLRVMHAARSRRPIIGLPLLVNQAGAWFLDGLFARWPFTEYWIEMLSTNQTSELGTIERVFGFRPATFDIGLLDRYMENRRYALELLRYIFTQRW
ncbi:MAG TPA: NAD-dependent epimerase/dehydratase family protein [Chloroflexi bacterium]|nr:NAD-dependent epimerase/dehydratase family protein [Chloroflexota bacterium]